MSSLLSYLHLFSTQPTSGPSHSITTPCPSPPSSSFKHSQPLSPPGDGKLHVHPSIIATWPTPQHSTSTQTPSSSQPTIATAVPEPHAAHAPFTARPTNGLFRVTPGPSHISVISQSRPRATLPDGSDGELEKTDEEDEDDEVMPSLSTALRQKSPSNSRVTPAGPSRGPAAAAAAAVAGTSARPIEVLSDTPSIESIILLASAPNAYSTKKMPPTTRRTSTVKPSRDSTKAELGASSSTPSTGASVARALKASSSRSSAFGSHAKKAQSTDKVSRDKHNGVDGGRVRIVEGSDVALMSRPPSTTTPSAHASSSKAPQPAQHHSSTSHSSSRFPNPRQDGSQTTAPVKTDSNYHRAISKALDSSSRPSRTETTVPSKPSSPHPSKPSSPHPSHHRTPMRGAELPRPPRSETTGPSEPSSSHHRPPSRVSASATPKAHRLQSASPATIPRLPHASPEQPQSKLHLKVHPPPPPPTVAHASTSAFPSTTSPAVQRGHKRSATSTSASIKRHIMSSHIDVEAESSRPRRRDSLPATIASPPSSRPKRARPQEGAYIIPTMDAEKWPSKYGSFGSHAKKKRKNTPPPSAEADLKLETGRAMRSSSRSRRSSTLTAPPPSQSHPSIDKVTAQAQAKVRSMDPTSSLTALPTSSQSPPKILAVLSEDDEDGDVRMNPSTPSRRNPPSTPNSRRSTRARVEPVEEEEQVPELDLVSLCFAS